MCKKIFVIAILVLIIGVLMPTCALAVNNHSNGEVTINTAWSGTLQNLITSLGAYAPSITKLSITAGTITDDDVDWMTKNLSSLKDLNISGNAAFEDNNLPTHAFSGDANRDYGLPSLVMNKLEKVVINPTNSELHFGFGSFFCGPDDNSQLKSVDIPKAKTFGQYPFHYNNNLTTINLPNATSFGDSAFAYNLKLASINLPSAESFGKNAFAGCELLYSINLPSIKSLGEHMFYCVNSGKQLILPATPPTLHPNTFQMYFNASKGRIIVPSGAESTYENAFDGGKPGWYGFPVTPPTLASTSPANGATEVDYTSNLEMTFSDNVYRGGSSLIQIKRVSDNVAIKTINVTDASQVSVVGKKVTINPTDDLPPNTALYVEIASTAIKDTNGSDAEYFGGITGSEKWSFTTDVRKYRIYYNGNSHTSGNPPWDTTMYAAGDAATIKDNFLNLKKTGHTLAGWRNELRTDAKVYAAGSTYIVSPGAGTNIFYAHWTPNQYTIDFDVDGGSSVDSITQGYNSKIITAPVSTKEGYRLEGWYLDATLFNKAYFPYTITTDATLYARWVVDQYTISFYTDGGSYVSDITQYPNTTIDTEPVTTKIGYTFDGWYDAYDNEVTFPYTIVQNDTLYAKWTPNPHTISFDVDGGSAVNNIEQGYGTTIFNAPESLKEGHNLEGWYIEDTFVNKVTFPYTIEGNATLYAKWEIEQYTINFDVNDGSAINPITQNYNTTIDTSPVTTKAGYTLEGWYKEATFTNKVTFPYTITGNAILYAKWNEVKVSDITFSSNNETYNIGVTGFITVSITPSNALNQNIIISNLNSNVASAIVDSMDPHKIWIETLKEGRTEIKVVTEDGSVSKTCVVVVVKPDVAEPETPQGGIVGALVDSNGDPLVGYYITMHSTPVTVVTDSNGKFSFPNIQFTSHTMIVESPVRSELARFAVSMVQGSNTTSTINNIINSIDITYANTTLNINVDLQAANPMATDFNIAQVGFTQKPIHVPVVNGRVENPATGEETDNTIYKLISLLIVIVLLLMYYSLRRFKMNIKS